ncbi:hypothetical protein C8Q80DRAFT_1165601 [Daedaleopsis nitida]|nr:hypothetical protein C8Q80DRAFT_1165601 [Daedaleopsis nitida]
MTDLTKIKAMQLATLDPANPLIISILENPAAFLAKTNGAMLLSLFFSSILDGVLLHQTYRYLRRYSGDTLFVKLLVASVLIVEAFRTVCDVHYSYHTLILKHGDLVDTLQHVTWSGNLNCMLWACISVLSHIFFIVRVSKIAPRFWIISVLATAFNLAQIATGIALGVRGFVLGGSAYLTESWEVAMGFTFSIVVDLLLSGALLTGLYKAHGHYKIISISEGITVYFVNTGLIVLVLDILGLAFALGASDTLYWAALNMVITKVYGTTLFSVLNSRALAATEDIKVDVFNKGETFRTIDQARRLATARQWNVPEVLSDHSDPLPPTINITVQTEREGDSMSAIDYDSMSKNEL